MNDWVRRSIEVAANDNYLDQIFDIYQIPYDLPRPINAETRRELERLFNERDSRGLIHLLLRQQKFPFQDPFVGFLRADAGSIDRNPQTVERLTRILHAMGVEGIIRGIEEPAQANRRLGALVHRWLARLPFPRLEEAEFLRAEGPALLMGSNGQLLDFCNRVLHCNLWKRPDLVAKGGQRYVIGEAKIITTPGGNQDKSFREVMEFIQAREGEAVRVGIMDGVVWVHEGGLYGTVRQLEDEVAFSALLLEDFLESLR